MLAAGTQLVDEPLDLGADLGRVRRAGQQHELRVARQFAGGAQQVRHALLAGDPADVDDGRHPGLYAVAG